MFIHHQVCEPLYRKAGFEFLFYLAWRVMRSEVILNQSPGKRCLIPWLFCCDSQILCTWADSCCLNPDAYHKMCLRALQKRKVILNTILYFCCGEKLDCEDRAGHMEISRKFLYLMTALKKSEENNLHHKRPPCLGVSHQQVWKGSSRAQNTEEQQHYLLQAPTRISRNRSFMSLSLAFL